MEVKGDRRGLRLLAFGFADETSLIEDLRSTLLERQAFLGHAQLAVEVDTLPLTATLFQRIAEVFERFPDLTLRGIQVRETGALIPLDGGRTGSPLVVRQTLRSGQRISHQGDLIVVGDVNPGAAVVATGDIMIFGWLRGTAYAGQPADGNRTVCALRFQPAQIRIGEVMALGDSQGEYPECARVEQGQVVVEPWHNIRLPEAVAGEPRLRRVERLARTAQS